MQRLLRLAILVPGLLLALPLPAQQGAAALPKESPKVRAKMLSGDYLTGKITKTEGDAEKSFTFEVTYKTGVLNEEMDQRRRALETAMKTARPNEMAKLNAEYQEVKQKLFDIVEVPYEFPLKAGKDLLVRHLKLPPREVDGRVVPYTVEERNKLRGDNPKVPGYAAELKDLEKAELIRAYLDKTKIKADAGKKKDGEPSEPMTYPVTMLVIVPAAEVPDGGLEIKPDPKVRAKMIDAAYIDGKLTKADPKDAHGFVVEVVRKTPVPNGMEQQRYNQLLKQYTDTYGKLNAKQLQDLTAQMKDAYSKSYDYKDVVYEFPLETAKDLSVRLEKLPPGPDGKTPKYSADELKKLKGDDPKAPGYTAKVEDLAGDVWVRIWLDKAKLKPKPGDDADVLIYYPVRMMMIKEPPAEKPGDKPTDKPK